MQGSMRSVIAAFAVTVTLIVVGVAAGASHAASAGCSDIRWLNGMTPAINKAVSAFNMASSGSFAAGESRLRSARVYAVRAGSPCSSLLKGAQRNWLRGVNVALVGLDQMRAGNYTSAISSVRTGTSYIKLATDYLTAYNS